MLEYNLSVSLYGHLERTGCYFVQPGVIDPEVSEATPGLQ